MTGCGQALVAFAGQDRECCVTAEGRTLPPRVPLTSSVPNPGRRATSPRGGELPAAVGRDVEGKVAQPGPRASRTLSPVVFQLKCLLLFSCFHV